MKGANSMSAIVVARVSSKEQEEEGYSVDAQADYLDDYCRKMELVNVKTFKITETASKPEERHKFNAMMQYAAENGVMNVVIEKVDRATRNSKSAVLIDEWLHGDEARKLHLPKNSLVLHKNSASQDRFMWDIHIAVAKQYANNLREEVQKGVREKLKQGWYPGTRPPIGYIHRGEKGHKTQIIDEEKAPLVKLAFELYDTGNYSISTLSSELKDRGLTNDQGKPLSKSYVHKMLTNTFYIGIMKWMGKDYLGSFEPLVEESTFERVQLRLSSGSTPVVQKHMTLLRGKVKCEQCNSTVSWYKQKNYWYGECKSQAGCTVRGCARQDEIEKQLAEYFEQLIAPSPAVIAWVKNELRRTHLEETNAYQLTVKRLTDQHKRIDRQLQVLYEDRLDGRISTEEYDRQYAIKKDERTGLAKQLEQLSQSNSKHVEQAIDILELTQNAAAIFSEKPLEVRRILLGDIFSSITLNAKHMKVEWREETQIIRKAVMSTKKLDKIFEPTSDPSKKDLTKEVRSTWLRGEDSNLRPNG